LTIERHFAPPRRRQPAPGEVTFDENVHRFRPLRCLLELLA